MKAFIYVHYLIHKAGFLPERHPVTDRSRISFQEEAIFFTKISVLQRVKQI